MSTTVDVSPFEQALKEFRTSLAPQEQSMFVQCRDSHELIGHVRKLDMIRRCRNPNALMQRLATFSKALTPYYDVVGILVQSHPEYAALAWGAFRLVLQLASNYHEFFDKLTRTLSHLAEVLPDYEELAASLKISHVTSTRPVLYQASSRIAASLTKIYVDLLVFLQSVVRIFTKKDTNNRSKFLVLNSLFWKPYDARFHDILESMQHHHELLKLELSLYGHQTTHIRLAKESSELKEELQKILQASAEEKDRSQTIQSRIAGINDTVEETANRVSAFDGIKEGLQQYFQASSEATTRSQEEIQSRIDEVSDTLQETANIISAIDQRLHKFDSNIADRFDTFSRNMSTTLRAEMRDSLGDRIRRWLSAPGYARDLESSRESRAMGTSEWFFGQQRFQQWLRTDQPLQASIDSAYLRKNTIWVRGNPGFGKTTMAGAVIDELAARAPEALRIPSRTLYFFFRQEPTLDNSTAAYRSLLTQLLSHYYDDEILDKFAFAMKYSPSSQPTGTRTELFDLLLLCTRLVGAHFIVLDAIDECSDNERLIRDLNKFGLQSRLILFSRPNVRLLHENIAHCQWIDIGRSNADDIRLFLTQKLEDFSHRDMLPEHADMDEYTHHLTKGADGMFLWARLMMDYLESEALSDQDRHDTILGIGMPEQLSVMYMRIIKLIVKRNSAERKMSKWIIMWLTFARRPLTAVELEESTKLLDEEKRAKSGRRDFDRAVVMACASLVEKAKLYDNITCFRFIHSTVRDYFQTLFTEDGMSRLPLDTRREVALIATPTPHSEICRGCLQYMLYYMPDCSLSVALRPLTERRVATKELEVAFPFSRYATILWINHLGQTKDEIVASVQSGHASANTIISLVKTLFRFLCQGRSIQVWIEATYILAHDHSHNVDVLSTWSNAMNADRARIIDCHDRMTDVLRATEDLPQYIRELEIYWGSSLRTCPGRIWTWDEINAFTPSRFSGHSSATVRTMSAICPSQAGITLSSQYLCKVSESTLESVGILSIWTSRKFETCSRQGFWFPKILTNECVEGWQARYEIWSIDESPKRLFIKTISLEGEEVRLNILQSLHRDQHNFEWMLQFPVTISPDLRRLAILRTIHWLDPVESGSEALLQSAILDLDLDPHSTRMWNALLYSNDHAKRIGRPALYTYWIRFSRSGNDIFFMDQQNLAIFSLHSHAHTGPSLVSFCVGAHDYDPLDFCNPRWRNRLFRNDEESIKRNFVHKIRQQIGDASRNSEPMRQLSVQFHPDKPLVAYCTGRHVFLWAFKNSQSRSALCYETPCSSVSYPEHIAFTSNSEQLIIKINDSELPIVQPLPDSILGALKDDIVKYENNDADGERHNDTRKPEESALDLWSFRSSNRDLSSTAHVQQLGNGDTLGYTPIASSSSASVLLWRDTAKGFEQQKLEIINFPAWEGIQSVTTSMKLPEPGESAVTLVLNKAVQPENSFGTAQIERFPAVITRQVNSLRPVPVDNTEDQRKRLQDGLEEGRGKRRRIAETPDDSATD